MEYGDGSVKLTTKCCSTYDLCHEKGKFSVVPSSSTVEIVKFPSTGDLQGLTGIHVAESLKKSLPATFIPPDPEEAFNFMDLHEFASLLHVMDHSTRYTDWEPLHYPKIEDRLSDFHRLCSRVDEIPLESIPKDYPTKEKPSKEIFLKDMRRYIRQYIESEGFDFDVYPAYILGISGHQPVVVSRELFRDSYEFYQKLAKYAIMDYNLKNHDQKTFEAVEVEKVNTTGSWWPVYFITFTAKEVEPPKANQDSAYFELLKREKHSMLHSQHRNHRTTFAASVVKPPDNQYITFQAQVHVVDGIDPVRVLLCRVRPGS